jgi:hypothetical protein
MDKKHAGARNELIASVYLLNTVKRHTMDRLDSLVRGTTGRRITYKELIA